MTVELESALTDLETKLVEPERQAQLVLRRIKRVRRMARLGDINGIVSQLASAPEAAEQLLAALRGLDGAFDYDAETAFADGDYLAELKSEAARQGVTLVERDGRLSVFPMLLKLDGKAPGVKVGRKLQRAIRPSVLIKSLKLAQDNGRFNAARFLEQLWQAYQFLLPAGWTPQSAEPGPTISLSRIHAMLTLHPVAKAEYPRDAFACDVLRLNRAPDTSTRDGLGFDLPASTGSKGSDRLTVYDEDGREHVFVGLRFAMRPAEEGAAHGRAA